MDDTNFKYGKLSVCNLGAAIGIVWGVMMLVLAYLSMFFDLGTILVDVFSSLYIGYDSTFMGGFIGLVWGLIDGFIFGALVAMVYNKCRCCCPCPTCKSGRCCGDTKKPMGM